MIIYIAIGVCSIGLMYYQINKFKSNMILSTTDDKIKNDTDFKNLNAQIINSDKISGYKQFKSYRKCTINNYNYITFKCTYLAFETEFMAIGLNNKIRRIVDIVFKKQLAVEHILFTTNEEILLQISDDGVSNNKTMIIDIDNIE